MKKPARSLELEKVRKVRIPEEGATVYYAIPQPVVGEDGTPNPSRIETWYPATVLGVQRIERTMDPDDYEALLEPHEGIGPISMEVSLLLNEPPTEDDLPPLPEIDPALDNE